MTMRSVVTHRPVPFVATGGVAAPARRVANREPVVVRAVGRAVIVGSVRCTIIVSAMRGALVTYTAIGTVAGERTRSLARTA